MKTVGTSLGKFKTNSCGQKIQFNPTLVRIVRCRIARTRLIPLYLFPIKSPLYPSRRIARTGCTGGTKVLA